MFLVIGGLNDEEGNTNTVADITRGDRRKILSKFMTPAPYV